MGLSMELAPSTIHLRCLLSVHVYYNLGGGTSYGRGKGGGGGGPVEFSSKRVGGGALTRSNLY